MKERASMAEQSQKNEPVYRHPGVPLTPIEEDALKEREHAELKPGKSAPDADKILNDRRRPITNHHGKDSF